MRRARARVRVRSGLGVVAVAVVAGTWFAVDGCGPVPGPIPATIEESNAAWVECPEGRSIDDDPDNDCRLLTGADAVKAKAAWEARHPSPQP